MVTETMEKTEEATAEIDLDKVIRNHVWASIGVGLVPLPMVDMVALTGIQLNMVRKIAKAYGVSFMKDKVKNTVGTLAGSVLPSTLGPSLASSISKSVPIVGQTVGALTMPIVAGASTYAVGKVFVQHFASGGTFLTFDPEKVKDYYAEMFEEGKKTAEEVASEIKKDEPEPETKKDEPEMDKDEEEAAGF